MRLFRPRTIAEALSYLRDDQDGALLYAGGVEVALGLRTRELRCTSLIDTKRIANAAGVCRIGGHVRIGPATRHQVVATDPIVAADLPLLGMACAEVGTIRIRMQGTLGGNFGYAHQHTDPGTAAAVYGGFVDLVSASGRRSVPIEEFWVGPYQPECGPGELIESIRLQPLCSDWVVVHDRVESLHRPPTAIVSMAARVVDGIVAECRIAAGGIPPRPLRLRVLERALTGAMTGDLDRAVAAAESALANAVAAEADLLGSAEFKVMLLAGLVRRAAATLIHRSKQQRRSTGADEGDR